MSKDEKIIIEVLKEKIEKTKLHVLTFATHEQGYFKTLKESCKILNIDLKVLGMGIKWKGFIEKLIKVKEYLKLCNDKDIILFVDGFDTFFVQPANVIIERYLMNYDNFFVCTSEGAYSSNILFLRIIEKMHLVFHNSIFKYNDHMEWDSLHIKEKYKDFNFFHNNLNLLNSGGWISNVFLAKKVLQYIPSFIDNDQVFLTNLYLDCNYLLKLQEKQSLNDTHSKSDLNFNAQNNLKYYNKIIIDNHNIIFHLFRGKRNLMLLDYNDCVNHFPFKPLINMYNIQGDEEIKKNNNINGKNEYLHEQNGKNEYLDEQNSQNVYLHEQNGKNEYLDEQNSQIQYLHEQNSQMNSQNNEINWKNCIYHFFMKTFFGKKDNQNNDGALKKIEIVKENNTDRNEWKKKKTILDNVYMGNTIRKIGQIENTFNYSIIDMHTHTSPCILHMHCLRNVDNIIHKMGLKNKYTSTWYSRIWYLFYSLKGTLNFNYFSLLFSTTVGFISFFLIYIKYVLQILIYIDNNFRTNKMLCLDKMMFLLNDIEFSCIFTFILSILYWIFYVFNKSILIE
ncbi:procollagen lysine 5-dioxygenase, putative [Plasmodium sp. DRC-Itaito]|nr:procollagen lysine 5-dioxygenase, putative [Plasmodium sp. DRC-Itaito]